MKISKSDTLIIKGIAIILMYIHHLFRFPERIVNSNYISMSGLKYNNFTLEYLIGDFGKICVGIFLFLSGFGLFLNKKNSLKDSISRARKFYFYYVYIFLITTPLGYFLLKGELIKGKIMYNGGLSEFISNLLLINTSYCGEWWYIALYIQLLILTPLIIGILEKNLKLSLIFHLSIYSLFVLCILLNRFQIINVFEINMVYKHILRLFNYQLIFYCGLVFAKYGLLSKINFSNSKGLSIIGIILIVLLRIKSNSIGIAGVLDIFYVPFFVLFTLDLIKALGNPLQNSLIILGKNSTNMWLTHTLFCYYYAQKLVFFPKLSILILIWLILITLITSIVLDKGYLVLTETFSYRKRYLKNTI